MKNRKIYLCLLLFIPLLSSTASWWGNDKLNRKQEIKLAMRYLHLQDYKRARNILVKQLPDIKDKALYNYCLHAIARSYKEAGRTIPDKYAKLPPLLNLEGGLENFEPQNRIFLCLSRISTAEECLKYERELEITKKIERRFELLYTLAEFYKNNSFMKKYNIAVKELNNLSSKILSNKNFSSNDRLQALRSLCWYDRKNRIKHKWQLFDIPYLSFNQILTMLHQGSEPGQYLRFIKLYNDDLTPYQKIRAYSSLRMFYYPKNKKKEEKYKRIITAICQKIAQDKSYRENLRNEAKWTFLDYSGDSPEVYRELLELINQEKDPQRLSNMLYRLYNYCEYHKKQPEYLNIIMPILKLNILPASAASSHYGYCADIYRKNNNPKMEGYCLEQAFGLEPSPFRIPKLAQYYARTKQVKKCIKILKKHAGMQKKEQRLIAEAKANKKLYIFTSGIDVSLNRSVDTAAAVFLKNKDYQSALSCYDVQLQASPWDRLAATRKIMEVYKQMGKSPKEITDFLNKQLAVPIKNEDARYLYDKICLLLIAKSKDYSDLKNSYNRLVSISTHNSRFNLTNSVGEILRKAGQRKEAWQIWIGAAEQCKRPRQRAYFYRSAARVSAEMGKFKRAKSEYAKAIELLKYWRDNLPQERDRKKWVKSANAEIKLVRKRLQDWVLDKQK